MLFREYQQRAHETATTPDIDVYTLGLIGECGSVASAIKKYKRDSPARAQVKREIKEELGDVLWYVSEIAGRFDLTLEEIATENIRKTEYLFKGRAVELGTEFPAAERFPRELTVLFREADGRLQMFADGERVGHSLTDNAHEDDGYRFHDAFHLAYMTFLGWSPVMRSILTLKRRSKPEVDEVEDGARAIALEEGISILVFSQSQPPAEGPCLFSEPGQIPFWLLEGIKKMTVNLEVSAKSVSDWGEAITAGFRVFDDLRARRGGTVRCDLEARTIEYLPPDAA